MDAESVTCVALEAVLDKPRRRTTKAAIVIHQQDDGNEAMGSNFETDQTAGDLIHYNRLVEEKNSSISPNHVKRFVCDVPGCEKAFMKPIFLEMHLRTHTDERPYSCPVDGCSRSYTRSWHLKRHVEKAHNKKPDDNQEQAPQRHRCTWQSCDKEYNSQDALRKHVARVHEGREFVGRHRPGERLACVHCGASFAKHSRLKSHLFHHTGEMPFRCRQEGCGKEFISQGKLKAHEKTHAGYECEKCPGDRYPTWSALRKHFKEKHNVKRCPKCDKTFIRAVHLEAHLATHEDEREAYLCSYEGCNKSYFELKNLHAHLKAAHQGVRFECVLCEKEFRSKQALRRHGKKCSVRTTEKRPVKTGVERKARKDKGIARKRAASWLSGWEEPVDSERSGYETTDGVDDTVDPTVQGIMSALVDRISTDDNHAVLAPKSEQNQCLQKATSMQKRMAPDRHCSSDVDTHVRRAPMRCRDGPGVAHNAAEIRNVSVEARPAINVVVISDDAADCQEGELVVFDELFCDLEEKSGDAEAVRRLQEIEEEKYAQLETCEDERTPAQAGTGETEVIEISDSDD